MVALAFIKNTDPLNKNEVDHINGDRSNNSVDNLRWVASSENKMLALHEQGLKIPLKGEEVASNKYSEETIRKICELLENQPKLLQKEVSKIIFGKDDDPNLISLIKSIKCGRTWKHISSEYNIICEKKEFKNSEEDIREICRMIENDPLVKARIISEKVFGNIDDKNLKLINHIRRRTKWKSISKDFKW